MSYFVICTFDLANSSFDDYQNAYTDLSEIGLNRSITANNGSQISLPTTTTAGQFNGESATQVRTDLLDRVKSAFAMRGFKSEIFISVGGDWAWGHSTT